MDSYKYFLFLNKALPQLDTRVVTVLNALLEGAQTLW